MPETHNPDPSTPSIRATSERANDSIELDGEIETDEANESDDEEIEFTNEIIEFDDDEFDSVREENDFDAEEIEVETPPGEKERVSKLIARAGICSRRAAEDLITSGEVSVNGHYEREPGLKADPNRDKIIVSGRPLIITEKTTMVLLFHKPKGCVTSKKDPQNRPTVYDNLPKKFLALNPVGRLDYDTSGVLLLTDDGELVHLLTHPSHGAEKIYQARVRGTVAYETVKRLQKGIKLDDGWTQPAGVKIVAQREKNALVQIKIREGRNRQVRRMLDFVGHPVSALRRTSFAGIILEGLLPGEFRILLPGEVKQLRKRVEKRVKPAKVPSMDAKPAPPNEPRQNARKPKLAGQPRAPRKTALARKIEKRWE